jgi:DNA-binding GntR family transcriptional regulator
MAESFTPMSPHPARLRLVPRGKYLDIAEVLAAEIADLPPGTRIASEHDIAHRFGVGRAAARAALQELQRRLLVRRIQGGGTFTAKRVDYLIAPDRSPSWSQTVRDAGAIPRTVVRSCDLVDLPADVAERLDRETGSPCFLLRRRSFTDNLPAAWGAEWVPADVLPELPAAVQVEESLDRILRDMAGVEPQRASSRASMEVASAEVAEELECGQGDPAWLVESVNRDARTGRMLCFTQRWIRADAIRVVFELGHL